MNSAPYFLKSMGYAFRVYLLAQKGTPTTLAARIAKRLSKDYRVFMDPAACSQFRTLCTPDSHAQHVSPLINEDRGDSPHGGPNEHAIDAAQFSSCAHTVACVIGRNFFECEQMRIEVENACMGRQQVIFIAPTGLNCQEALPSSFASEELKRKLSDAWDARITFHETGDEGNEEDKILEKVIFLYVHQFSFDRSYSGQCRRQKHNCRVFRCLYRTVRHSMIYRMLWEIGTAAVSSVTTRFWNLGVIF